MNRSAKAKQHIVRARDISSRAKSSLPKIKESEMIAKIRRDREMIWDEKIPHCVRHVFFAVQEFSYHFTLIF